MNIEELKVNLDDATTKVEKLERDLVNMNSRLNTLQISLGTLAGLASRLYSILTLFRMG